MDVTMETSLNIISFFAVHSPHSTNSLMCGDLNVQAGFQSTLAFYYALQNLPGNMPVGGVVMDTCGSTPRVTSGLTAVMTGEDYCGYDLDIKSDNTLSYLTVNHRDTQAITMNTDMNQALVLSPTVTSDQFLSWHHYLTASTPDSVQAKVMSDIVRHMQWPYVAVIHSGKNLKVLHNTRHVIGKCFKTFDVPNTNIDMVTFAIS